MSDVTNVQGTAMSERAIAEFLREQGIGLLSLARGSETHAVPVSFGYTDGPRRLFFDLVRFGGDSRKLAFADGTTTACFVTYDVESRFDWRSVVATGPVREVTDDEQDTME